MNVIRRATMVVSDEGQTDHGQMDRFCSCFFGNYSYFLEIIAQRPRSHGFYRFFAFELLLILLLSNIEYWIEDPYSPYQLISWVFLSASLIMAIHGFYLLRVIGKPQAAVPGSSDFGFENTANLVTIGAYNYIRHPLYTSLLLMDWGIFLNIGLYGAGPWPWACRPS